jgi:hypothetical protein
MRNPGFRDKIQRGISMWVRGVGVEGAMLNEEQGRLGRIVNENAKATVSCVLHLALEAETTPFHAIK